MPRLQPKALAVLLSLSLMGHAVFAEPAARCAIYVDTAAASRHEGSVEGRVVEHLWAWVRAHTAAQADPPPAVCVLDANTLESVRQLAEPGNTPGFELLAAYDRRNRMILLKAPFDPSDPVSQSILVHELVHHAQTVTGQRFACPAEAERAAFVLQEKWLRMAELDLDAAFGMNRLAFLVMTTCSM